MNNRTPAGQHSILGYFTDAIESLGSSKSTIKELYKYFERVNSCNHIAGREFSYISMCYRNRICFTVYIMEKCQHLHQQKMTFKDFHEIIKMIFPDFPETYTLVASQVLAEDHVVKPETYGMILSGDRSIAKKSLSHHSRSSLLGERSGARAVRQSYPYSLLLTSTAMSFIFEDFIAQMLTLQLEEAPAQSSILTNKIASSTCATSSPRSQIAMLTQREVDEAAQRILLHAYPHVDLSMPRESSFHLPPIHMICKTWAGCFGKADTSKTTIITALRAMILSESVLEEAMSVVRRYQKESTSTS